MPTGTLTITQEDQRMFQGLGTISPVSPSLFGYQSLLGTWLGGLLWTTTSRTGDLDVTQVSQTVASAATVLIAGSSTRTQAGQTTVTAGSVSIQATTSEAQANQSVTAVAGSSVQAVTNAVQAAGTVSTSGTILIVASLTQTQTSQMVVSTGGGASQSFALLRLFYNAGQLNH